jgi:MFS family permease
MNKLIIFFCCWFAGIFAGMNSNIFSVILPQVMTDLNGTQNPAVIGQMGSYILSLFLFGWVIGGIFFGILGDILGRVKSLTLSIIIYSVFTGVSSFVDSIWQLGAFRFITGFGVGGTMVCISILLSEVWPERSRALALGALITSYQIGVFVSGLLCKIFPDWHNVLAIGFLPLFLSLVILKFLKEPEKWVQNVKQKFNPSKHFAFLFVSSEPKNLWIGSIAFGGLLIGYWASLSWVPTWIQSLTNSSTDAKNYATMFHGAAAVIGCTLSGFLVNFFGRLPTLFISFFGAFLTSLVMFMSHEVFSTAIYWEYSILGIFIGVLQGSLYIYLPELFPTKIRGTSVGFCLNCGRVVTSIAVLFLGVLVSLMGGYIYALIAFSSFYALGGMVCLFAKETKAIALPE